MRNEAKTMRKLTLLLVAMALAVLLAALPAQAATTFTVNTTNDASDANTSDGVCATTAAQCTLRAAIEQANALAGDDVIEFAPSVSGTIMLGGNNQLSISSNLKINGPGADVLSVSADDPALSYDSKRAFSVGSGTTAEISGLTITGARCYGGGCAIRNEGTLAVSDTSITGNTSYDTSPYSGGGGIYNLGTLRVQRSTISGNTAYSAGGGIYSKTQPLPDDFVSGHLEELVSRYYAIDGDTLTTKTIITNSTISGNSGNGVGLSGIGGGGVYNHQGLTEIGHSTITNNGGADSGVLNQGNFKTRTDVFSSIISGNANTDVDYHPDIASNAQLSWNSFNSLGYNLIGDGNATDVQFRASSDQRGVSDPGLEPLRLNAPGSTKTHALKAGSLAINAGAPEGACPAIDQRGFDRPQEGTCDIGSFEKENTAPEAPVITDPAEGSYDNDGSFALSGTAEPNSSVELFDGGNSLNQDAAVDAEGSWRFELRSVSEGSHSYTLNATDRAGNTSAASQARTVIVDKSAPGAPLITSPAHGARLNVRSFSVSGTVEAGAKVELYDNGLSKGIVTADTYGKWKIALSGVSEGSHSYLAKATDAAGNASAPSSQRTVIVDTTKPKVTSVKPAEDATGVVAGTNVYAAFSEAMKADSINVQTFQLFTSASATPITATVTYDAATKMATLNPTADLKRGVTYKAVVTSEAQDLAGNALDQNPTQAGNQQKVWVFTISP